MAKLHAVLAAKCDGDVSLDSSWERLMDAIINLSGIAKPERQYRVTHPRDGAHVAKLDLAWPRARVGVSVKGENIHRRRGKYLFTARQEAELASLHWRIIPVTDDDLRGDFSPILRRIRDALSPLQEPAPLGPEAA